MLRNWYKVLVFAVIFMILTSPAFAEEPIMLENPKTDIQLITVNSSATPNNSGNWSNFNALMTRPEYRAITPDGQVYWQAIVVQLVNPLDRVNLSSYKAVPAFSFYAGPSQLYVVYIQEVAGDQTCKPPAFGSADKPLVIPAPIKKPASLW